MKTFTFAAVSALALATGVNAVDDIPTPTTGNWYDTPVAMGNNAYTAVKDNVITPGYELGAAGAGHAYNGVDHVAAEYTPFAKIGGAVNGAIGAGAAAVHPYTTEMAGIDGAEGTWGEAAYNAVQGHDKKVGAAVTAAAAYGAYKGGKAAWNHPRHTQFRKSERVRGNKIAQKIGYAINSEEPKEVVEPIAPVEVIDPTPVDPTPVEPVDVKKAPVAKSKTSGTDTTPAPEQTSNKWMFWVVVAGIIVVLGAFLAFITMKMCKSDDEDEEDSDDEDEEP